MDFPKSIVSNQKEESISKQRVKLKGLGYMHHTLLSTDMITKLSWE